MILGSLGENDYKNSKLDKMYTSTRQGKIGGGIKVTCGIPGSCA